MNPFLLVHLICVGIWLGCILTEALFERALLGQGRQQEKILVGLHQRVDLFVEIPAFVLVLVTGALMLSDTATSKLLDIKVGLGLLAILANLYCVGLVFRRTKAVRTGHWSEFERLDHLQHKWGAVVLLALLGALGLGVYIFVQP